MGASSTCLLKPWNDQNRTSAELTRRYFSLLLLAWIIHLFKKDFCFINIELEILLVMLHRKLDRVSQERHELEIQTGSHQPVDGTGNHGRSWGCHGIACTTLGKSMNLIEHQYLHLQNGVGTH